MFLCKKYVKNYESGRWVSSLDARMPLGRSVSGHHWLLPAGSLLFPPSSVISSFSPLPLHTSVLEPHLHLSLCEVQGHSYLVPPQPGQVVRVPELFLQLADLELGEGGSFLAGLRAQLLQLCSMKTHITTSKLA